MRVVVIGAGPAGLYLAYLLARHQPRAEIRVVEQNPDDATFGFGVVFSDRALEFLRDDDPETYDGIMPSMESWSDMVLDCGRERVRIDGVGFSAVGRLELLRLLRARAEAAGIRVEYDHPVAALEEVAAADLVVGADGVHSLVRRAHAVELGARVTQGANRFVWYGTPRLFDTLTQTFRRNAHGVFNAHHYRYSPRMSTFIVETDATTWARAGFATMSPDATTAYCEGVFADTLDGHPLVSNRSVWRCFPRVTSARWWTGNRVLVGDAAHTAHFSIGSGTRLAMEDAIALARALRQHGDDLAGGLAAYEAARRPIVATLVAAADASADWYERFAEHMTLDPLELAMRYVTRSGRVDPDRLRRVSPRFMAAYAAWRRPSERHPAG